MAKKITKNIENEFSGLIRFVEQKDLVVEKEICGFAVKGAGKPNYS